MNPAAMPIHSIIHSDHSRAHPNMNNGHSILSSSDQLLRSNDNDNCKHRFIIIIIMITILIIFMFRAFKNDLFECSHLIEEKSYKDFFSNKIVNFFSGFRFLRVF